MDAKIEVGKAADGSHAVSFAGTWTMRELDRVYRAMQLALRGHHLAERMRSAAGMPAADAQSASLQEVASDGEAALALAGADAQSASLQEVASDGEAALALAGEGEWYNDGPLSASEEATERRLAAAEGHGMGALGSQADAPSVWDGLLEGRASGGTKEKESDDDAG